MKALLTASLMAAFLPMAFAQTKAPLSDAQKQEVVELKAKAAKLTKQVGQIALNNNLQENDDAVKLLKQIADELDAIHDRLKALEDSRTTDRQDTDQNTKDIAALKKLSFNGYLQTQFFNSNQHGASQPNAFLVRRARLGMSDAIDKRATLKMSFEFADDTNRQDVRLKDAVLAYDMQPDFHVPSRFDLGQFSIPLGYDIERSDADRELAERSVYEQAEFKNERSRGIVLRANPDKHVEVGVGAMDALTVDDPEQSGLAPGQGSQVAAVGYLRALGPGYRIGLSGFAGDRPAYSAGGNTSPLVHRSFTYLDAEYHPTFIKNLTLRGEGMLGRDRVPSTTASSTKTANPMSGFQAVATYDFNAKNQINFRWQGFDPNLNTAGNNISGVGASYQYFFSPVAKFQLTHEVFTDQSRAGIGQKTYYQTTFRVQFRF